MKICYATISKTGNRRNNEDALRIMDRPDCDRWTGVVCDGMGGHAFGEIASATVSDAIKDYWEKHIDVEDCEDKAIAACREARNALSRKAYSLSHAEMGTTMVMASIKGDTVTIAHAGDSRCYLQRPGEGLLHRTRDHTEMSYGWEIISRCFFSYRPEAALPDVARFTLQAGDRLLLCTDGLYKSMKHNELQEMMMGDKPLGEILDDYSQLCETQGDDNYTAILLEVG